MAVKKSAGWSFARVLLLTAVVGAVAGVVLARNPADDDRSPEEMAEEEGGGFEEPAPEAEMAADAQDS